MKIFIFASISIIAYLAIMLSAFSHIDAMKACQLKHSFEVCQYSINR